MTSTLEELVSKQPYNCLVIQRRKIGLWQALMLRLSLAYEISHLVSYTEKLHETILNPSHQVVPLPTTKVVYGT